MITFLWLFINFPLTSSLPSLTLILFLMVKSWSWSSRLAPSRCSCLFRLRAFETTRQFRDACLAKRCSFFPLSGGGGQGGGPQEWHGAGSLWEVFKYRNCVCCFAVDTIKVVLNFKEVIMITWWHKGGAKNAQKDWGENHWVGEGTMGCGILKMAAKNNGRMWDPQRREKRKLAAAMPRLAGLEKMEGIFGSIP